MPKSLTSMVIVCLFAALAHADEANRSAADLINALASTDTKVVETARETLLTMGGDVVNQLEDHETENPQVVTSIKYVLNRICNYYVRIDPKREKEIKSPGGNGTQVVISVKNNTAKPVKLLWIDRSGSRIPYHDIDPGAEIEQRSFEDHCWIIVDQDGHPLGIYRATYQDGRILVKQKFF